MSLFDGRDYKLSSRRIKFPDVEFDVDCLRCGVRAGGIWGQIKRDGTIQGVADADGAEDAEMVMRRHHLKCEALEFYRNRWGLIYDP